MDTGAENTGEINWRYEIAEALQNIWNLVDPELGASEKLEVDFSRLILEGRETRLEIMNQGSQKDNLHVSSDGERLIIEI